jgi:DNA-binding transcriptional MerR regulator
MKIGEVSKKCNIPISNLYYYIRLGLLVPSYKGEQHYFDEKSLKDLDFIIRLKKMSFTLEEIHAILSFQRIMLYDSTDMKFILDKKYQELIKQKQDVESALMSLEEYRNQLQCQEQAAQETKGMHLKFLEILACPDCSCPFNYDNLIIQSQHIISGNVSCRCGYKARIEMGILVTDNKYEGLYDNPDTERSLYKNLLPKFVSLFQYSYFWMNNKMAAIDLADKIILETHINAYCYLYSNLEYMNPKGSYILIDKYPETLMLYKSLIEQHNYDLDILYIADNSTHYPIKHNTIDLFLDFFGSNELNFFSEEYLIAELLPYLKAKSTIIGTYFHVINGHKTMENLLKLYPESSRNNFNYKLFVENLKTNNFILADSKTIGSVNKTGNKRGFDFHQDGEDLYLTSFMAQRS